MRRQVERYRRLGRGARVVERSRRHLSIELREGADLRLVAETAAIERECCPFFYVSWDRAARRLSFAVSSAEDEPALDAILFSLGLAESALPR
ncbi:MAG TPA: hypothetical protein VGX51_04850 [Solirubrobacteraceae bacterium]|jgi:hypothetical protein|nr:hypothetical protein [Solirubrobacteraceae bacterium]